MFFRPHDSVFHLAFYCPCHAFFDVDGIDLFTAVGWYKYQNIYQKKRDMGSRMLNEKHDRTA